MAMFKKTILAGVASALLLAAPLPVLAAGAEVAIGTEIAKMILGGLARKGTASLFDVMSGGPRELTPDDLKLILDDTFEAYELAHVADVIKSLNLATAVYNRHASINTRKAYALRLKEDAGKALELLDAEIKNTDKLFKLMGDYVFAKTVQLTFKSEEHLLDGGAGINVITAEDAAKGISDVRRYLEAYYHDPLYDVVHNSNGNRIHGIVPCVRWEPSVPLFAHGGGDYANQNKNRPEAATSFCMGWFGEYLKNKWEPVDFAFFSHTGVFKNPRHNIWYYSYRKPSDDTALWIGADDAENRANADRLAAAMEGYPEHFAGLSSHLKGWYEIVTTLSQNAGEKAQATADMQALGLIPY